MSKSVSWTWQQNDWNPKLQITAWYKLLEIASYLQDSGVNLSCWCWWRAESHRGKHYRSGWCQNRKTRPLSSSIDTCIPGSRFRASDTSVEGRKEMFYLTTHSTHFIYGYMASDIWLRIILIVRKETRYRHIGYSFRLAARVLLYAPSQTG